MPYQILDDGAPPPPGADPKLHELFGYWARIRGGKRYPARADFDPIDVAALMPYVSMVDVRKGSPRFVYRLAGTRLVEILKKEITGRPVGYGVKPDELESVLERYRLVADRGVAIYQRDRTQEQSNDYTGVDRLMLPLGPADGSVEIVLSIVVPLVEVSAR